MFIFEKTVAHAKLPQQATYHSAGYDVSTIEAVELAPNTGELVGLGIKLVENDRKVNGILVMGNKAMYLTLHMRSSIRIKGISQLEPGIIDSDYRDEIKIFLFNHTDRTIQIPPSRIGQLIPTPMLRGVMDGCGYSGEERTGGFGSTNLNWNGKPVHVSKEDK